MTGRGAKVKGYGADRVRAAFVDTKIGRNDNERYWPKLRPTHPAGDCRATRESFLRGFYEKRVVTT